MLTGKINQEKEIGNIGEACNFGCGGQGRYHWQDKIRVKVKKNKGIKIKSSLLPGKENILSHYQLGQAVVKGKKFEVSK